MYCLKWLQYVHRFCEKNICILAEKQWQKSKTNLADNYNIAVIYSSIKKYVFMMSNRFFSARMLISSTGGVTV